MPIRPENKHRYPKNWKQIRLQILERANHCCEGSPAFPDCRIENYSFRNKITGEVTTSTEVVEQWELVDDQKASRIVLTIGHLDHVPENCDPENLKSWCQRCHLVYDAKHHAETARETRRLKLNNAELALT